MVYARGQTEDYSDHPYSCSGIAHAMLQFEDVTAASAFLVLAQVLRPACIDRISTDRFRLLPGRGMQTGIDLRIDDFDLRARLPWASFYNPFRLHDVSN